MIRPLPLIIAMLIGCALWAFDIPPAHPAAEQTLPSTAGSVYVWPSPIGNRRQYSGAIFYIQHTAGAPLQVTLRYRSMGTKGQLRDGQPANLVLRIFGPDDRSLAAATIGQPDERIYELILDLSNQPAGRYRLALTGWHGGCELQTQPPQPIGVIGGGTLGIQSPSDTYLLVPPDVSDWTLQAASTTSGIQLSLLTDDDTILTTDELPDSPRAVSPIWLTSSQSGPGDPAAAPQLRHLRLRGDGPVMLNTPGIPAVLWSTPEAAAIPTYTYRHGRRLAFAWQEPLADYLSALTPGDLALPDLELPPIDVDQLTDTQLQQLGQVAVWDNGLATAISLLRHNQIADPRRPDCGLFVDNPADAPLLPLNPDGDNSYSQVHYLNGLSGLLAAPVAGYNPWQGNPVLARRVAAAFCQILLQIPARQTVNNDFVHRKFLGLSARTAWPYLPESLREPIAAGLLEEFSRDGYFDGYQSNQGLNVQVGLRSVAELTGDPVLKAWHERFLTAFLQDTFVDVNHGQTPAGFYQESGGLDGAYNSYSLQLMITLYRQTLDPRLRASIERNGELLRHLAVTMPDSRFVSARCWNTRTDSNAFRWHNHRAGADIPSVATFLHPGSTTYAVDSTDRDLLIKSIKKTWDRPVRPGLDAKGKFWSDGGLAAERAVPYADPLPLACTQPGPLTRAFGDTYQIMQRGPWYAVFYTGDRWCVGAPGSGLATLRHQDLGPLILADTKKDFDSHHVPPAFPLVMADLWQGGSTEHAHGTVAANGDDVTISLTPIKEEWAFSRTYTLTADGLTTTLEALPEHRLVLPLVNGPDLQLIALDANGQPTDLTPDAEEALSGWRWQLGEKSITLHYGQPCITRLLTADEPCSPATLTIVEVSLPGDAPLTLRIAP